MATIRQIKTKEVSLKSIMRRKAFVWGFTEVRGGKPFDPDRYSTVKEQWDYERGRLLAREFDGILKRGQAVTLEAIRAYARGRDTGALI